jgi:histidyl-tRNA synthetase
VKNKQALQENGGAARAAGALAVKGFAHMIGEADRTADTSMYYGFTPVKAPELKQEDLALAKQLASREALRRPEIADKEELEPVSNAEEKIAIIRSYMENGMQELPHPLMLYYRKPFPGSGLRRQPRDAHFGLDIIGSPRGVSEAIIIQTIVACLKEDGFDQFIVELNGVGDKDAMAKHERELGLYYKKHSGTLDQKFKTTFKQSPFYMLTETDAECRSFCEGAPKSVSYLGEAGRRHFMEVLEYLESLDIPYRLNHALLGHQHFASHVLFKIKIVRDDGSETTVATGARYNNLSRKLGFKKELPAMSATVRYRRAAVVSDRFRPIAPPKFYLVQFGNDARRKCLSLIDMLRRERIAVHHSLTRDKLLPQMAAAESLKVPFVLIMGQKEALDGTVVVRNIGTRAQETLRLDELIPYLRKLK